MTHIEKLQKLGIRRVRAGGKVFSYRRPGGGAVSGRDLERIRHLALPPAWTDVLVHPSATGRLQALGRDKAGRWQYRYHPSFLARQQEKKYERLLHFADALPRMRKVVDRDLRRRGLGRAKVMACILRVLSTCFIRAGSAVYAARHGSYGVATLLPRHVQVKGDLVVFDFPGKSHQPQHRELRDRRVARIVRALKAYPGEVFKFLEEDGQVVDVKRHHINDYIHEVMGPAFSAKDFRTWAGTLICACMLAKAGPEAETKAARKKKVVEAVKRTAEELGNTPAICKASYIQPSVLSSFERGEVVEKYFDAVEELVEHSENELHGSEKALVKLLEKSTEAA